MLIRTWNLFHGNTKPPQRHAFLEEMVRLAVSGEPDVVALQEIPAWALPLLGEWSGYTAVIALAARPMLGPFPSNAAVGRVLTSFDNGLLRSAFSGQGNAILVAPRLRVLDRHTLVLNPRRFRRAQADWLELDVRARLAWAKERRVSQVVRVADGERTVLVSNLHATSYRSWPKFRQYLLLGLSSFLASPPSLPYVDPPTPVFAQRSTAARCQSLGAHSVRSPGLLERDLGAQIDSF